MTKKFKIDFSKNNRYDDEYNRIIKSTFKKIPKIKIIEEQNEIILVEFSSEQQVKATEWLIDNDALKAIEVEV